MSADIATFTAPVASMPKKSALVGLPRKLAALKWLPSYLFQRITRAHARGRVHLIFALADHFEPAIVPGDGRARAPLAEQNRRVAWWCAEYPKGLGNYRDVDGHGFAHTYFFPAEQYEREQVDMLADHCRSGWGEIEIHLHHGVDAPDTAANTYRQILEFRDVLVARHGALCFLDGSGSPRYAFVHGNFALANSAQGYACGVDNEMQILADTGCYADMSMPAAAFHPAQIAKINSLYECGRSLDSRAPHRTGRNLRVGRMPAIFPLNVQGPLLLDFDRQARNGVMRVENAALTAANPPSLRRLRLWKKAAITVQGRPDWIFIKLHCHSMDATQQNSVIGEAMCRFLTDLLNGAAERQEIIHFATAREMVNIIWAACDGREGNPGDYRNYRLHLNRRHVNDKAEKSQPQLSVKE